MAVNAQKHPWVVVFPIKKKCPNHLSTLFIAFSRAVAYHWDCGFHFLVSTLHVCDWFLFSHPMHFLTASHFCVDNILAATIFNNLHPGWSGFIAVDRTLVDNKNWCRMENRCGREGSLFLFRRLHRSISTNRVPVIHFGLIVSGFVCFFYFYLCCFFFYVVSPTRRRNISQSIR